MNFSNKNSYHCNIIYITYIINFKRAELLYLFADENRRHYHLSIPAVTKHYKSSGYKDELVWAAAWVYRATGNDLYLKQVK